MLDAGARAKRKYRECRERKRTAGQTKVIDELNGFMKVNKLKRMWKGASFVEVAINKLNMMRLPGRGEWTCERVRKAAGCRRAQQAEKARREKEKEENGGMEQEVKIEVMELGAVGERVMETETETETETEAVAEVTGGAEVRDERIGFGWCGEWPWGDRSTWDEALDDYYYECDY
jgi:hypothetical protein